MAILGLNLLLGFSGQVCLAQGAFFACGAYTTAILASRYGIDPLLTLPVATVVTALVGVAIGLPALRLPGLQLAIVTFGIAAVVPQLILKLDDFTGGVTGLGIDLPEPPAWFSGDQEAWLYCLCAAGAGFCVVVMRSLVRGDTGRTLRALRDNALIAESLGHRSHPGAPRRVRHQLRFRRPGRRALRHPERLHQPAVVPGVASRSTSWSARSSAGPPASAALSSARSSSSSSPTGRPRSARRWAVSSTASA